MDDKAEMREECFQDKKKTKFIAYLQQGMGCDYTIGCGNLLWEIEAFDEEEAKALFKVMIAESCSSEERRLERFRIFQVADEDEIDLKAFYNELDERIKRKEIEKIEEKEKKELERLSKKYGNK